MARIQILELPTIYRPEGPDETPFVLVIDEYQQQRFLLDGEEPPPAGEFDGVAEQIGARAVLVFAETVEIPANEVTVGPDGTPIRMHFEGDFSQLYKQADQVAEDLARRFKLGVEQ